MTESSHEPYDDLKVLAFPFMAILVGIVLDEANKRIKFIGIPDTILQFSFAFFASIIINKCLPLNIATKVDLDFTWTALQPQTILTVLLPPLIFESSFKINSHMFFAKLGFISTLTAFVYVVTLALSALICLPILCLVVGTSYTSVILFMSILVATDPVAVVAMLEEYGAPHKLRILIEGESLLNDGLALTAYRVLVDFLKLEIDLIPEVAYWNQLIGLFLCLIVSPILGYLSAAILAWIISKIKDLKKQQPLIIASVYGIFILCDKIGGSSALGMVFFGVTLNYYKEKMSPETTEIALNLWAALGYWANNVIFIFAGYTVGRQMFKEPLDHNYKKEEELYFAWGRENILNILMGVLLFPVMLVARIVSVYMFYKLTGNLVPSKLPKISDMVILAYAGLRGALGLILALELTKMPGFDGFADTKLILHMTCASTLTCLMFQGMTFSSVMNKEGITSRSKYVKETCLIFSRCVKAKVNELLKKLREKNNTFLRATNWTEVTREVQEELKIVTEEVEREQQEQQQEQQMRREVFDIKENEEMDVRINFYGLLIAKSRDAWTRGALSGSTAHVIISLLEHGIDEGSITASDVEEHLNHVKPYWIFRIVCKLSEWFYNFVSCLKFIWIPFADFGGDPMFVDVKTLSYKAKRKFEKWWLLHTAIFTCYSIALAWAMFDKNPDNLTARKCVFMTTGLLLFSTLIENLYLLKKIRQTSSGSATCVNRWSRLFQNRQTMKDFILLIITSGVMLVTTCCSYLILMLEECRVSEANCVESRYVHFALTMVCCIYRLLRSIPWIAITVYEKCSYRLQSRNRIRLAVLDYLHFLMKEIKISKELFPKSSFRVAKKEMHRFKAASLWAELPWLEGLWRLEFKDHEEENDTQRVNKTRQAIRMMSSEFKTTIATLKQEGFVPESAVDRWEEFIVGMRERAESVIKVDPLHIKDWLICSPWIRSMGKAGGDMAVDFLADMITNSQIQVVQPKQVIHTNGTSIWFLQKGICKVHQYLPNGKRAHDTYLAQGEFLGTRNVLLHRRISQQLPITFPKRRYETTTICEMVQLRSDVIDGLLKAEPKIYTEVNRWLQKAYIREELKRFRHDDSLSEEDFNNIFAKGGQIVGARQVISVLEEKIAIIGCYTSVIRSSRAMDGNRHVIGPARVTIEPMNEIGEGFILIVDRNKRETPAVSLEERSNYSYVHDADSHKLIEMSHSTSQDSKVKLEPTQ